MRQNLPLARRDSLIIKELEDETLIYDIRTDKAHCLNPAAALIWKSCDGKTTAAELRQLLGESANAEVADEVVWLALDQLAKFGLLSGTVERPVDVAAISRRELVRKVGFATLALPLIISITAPLAQAQASGLPPGSCCQNPSECGTGNCAQNPSCVGLPSTKACI